MAAYVCSFLLRTTCPITNRDPRVCVRLLQIVAQLLSFPLGRLWARVVPNVKIFGVSINPGPFTVKEHVLITIMATVGYSSAYAVRVYCSRF